MISHGNGITTFYGHLSEILVRPGQKIERWDVIGKVGSTGKSTGPHLHYEVHDNNKKVDPIRFILDDEY
jgi:murein DD-endopeptidase MepM/ murein hydrolase activator NlpD